MIKNKKIDLLSILLFAPYILISLFCITGIPEWLAKMQGLEDLSFSGTSITSLPEDISAWKSLRILQLGDLKMTTAEMKRIREALPKTAVVY